MMTNFTDATGVAQVIQLAVAPVFLLAGVGATLNVLAARIGRIIDRARIMEEQLEHAANEEERDLQDRLGVLSRRAKLISAAIGLCVTCGLLVSLVVTGLFVSYTMEIDLAVPIAVIFVIAMLSLAAALLAFLREVFLATRSLRFGMLRRRQF